MRTILLFGAGKSATVLIEYLVKSGPANDWTLIVADADLQLVQDKLNGSDRDKAVAVDVQNNEQRTRLIKQADIVISLLPPSLHYIIALDCLQFKKNLLTASYIDPEIEKLNDEIKNSKLLFLYEMGLDPGIDHMSAKKIIDEVQEQGGRITS